MNRHGRVPIWDYQGDSLRDTYKLPIHEIVKTLDETYKGAVNILIEHSQEQKSVQGRTPAKPVAIQLSIEELGGKGLGRCRSSRIPSTAPLGFTSNQRPTSREVSRASV
jgi:hypothetical protein